MKIRLTDALHARPASLFVQLATRFASEVTVRTAATAVNGKDILEVLSLGAQCGSEIEVVANGDDAEAAERALAELVARGFDADLVPETGAAAVEGIAIGRAVVLERRPSGSPNVARSTAPNIERARLAEALASAVADVALLVNALPKEEAELFAPEIEILRSLEPLLLARIDRGESAEDAVHAETASSGPGAASDLILDAGVRLAASLAGREGEGHRIRMQLAALEGEALDDVVLVVEDLPPSVVASLPARVVGIVASDQGGRGHASHAAILARGRDVPLVFVPHHVVTSIAHGESLVVDSTVAPARVWNAPSDSLIADARARRAKRAAALEEDERSSLDHLGVAVRANIGSLHERVPHAAEGIGLFRTELAFAGRATCPSARELEIALLVVARRARGEAVTVRLFDGGGDKPLLWLTAPDASPDARGMELLFANEAVLATALRAIVAARRGGANVRVLLPLVRSAGDLIGIRARVACELTIDIGAMIETPAAVDDARAIAEASDFVCIGTNDLAALSMGVNRADGAKRALDAQLLGLVRRVVESSHDARRSVTVCGEIAADQSAALALVGVGVDSLSIAPSRVSPVRRVLAAASRENCVAAARAILSDE